VNRVVLLLLALCAAAFAQAHGVASGDKAFIEANRGANLVPYMYLGAKHMVTGFDHLLFLCGVIFFLYRLKDVALYVTLFAVGHSTTLLLGVLNGWHVNPYAVDAIIGLSIVYCAIENLGGFRALGFQPNKKAAVLFFGFVHGFGLATKLQEFSMSQEGLVANVLAFNVGVEVGQLLALGVIVVLMRYWQATAGPVRHALASNVILMTAGFVLAGYQFTGYLTQ